MNLKAPENPDSTKAILLLGIAIVLEVGWVFSLRLTNGFSRFWPSLLNVLLMVLPAFCLARAVRSIPEPILYSIWTGASIALVSCLAAVFGTDRFVFGKMIGFVFIIVGIYLASTAK